MTTSILDQRHLSAWRANVTWLGDPVPDGTCRSGLERVDVPRADEQDHDGVPCSRTYCLSVSVNFV